jgi:hypothetical protein
MVAFDEMLLVRKTHPTTLTILLEVAKPMQEDPIRRTQENNRNLNYTQVDEQRNF